MMVFLYHRFFIFFFCRLSKNTLPPVAKYDLQYRQHRSKATTTTTTPKKLIDEYRISAKLDTEKHYIDVVVGVFSFYSYFSLFYPPFCALFVSFFRAEFCCFFFCLLGFSRFWQRFSSIFLSQSSAGHYSEFSSSEKCQLQMYNVMVDDLKLNIKNRKKKKKRKCKRIFPYQNGNNVKQKTKDKKLKNLPSKNRWKFCLFLLLLLLL